jgi:hypothetical protein
LEENIALFEMTRGERKSVKINVKMGSYLKTRNPLQCRSHHQKMLEAHKTVQGIIAFLKSEETEEMERATSAQYISDLKGEVATPETQTNKQDLKEIDILLDYKPSSLWEKLTIDRWESYIL